MRGLRSVLQFVGRARLHDYHVDGEKKKRQKPWSTQCFREVYNLLHTTSHSRDLRREPITTKKKKAKNRSLRNIFVRFSALYARLYRTDHQRNLYISSSVHIKRIFCYLAPSYNYRIYYKIGCNNYPLPITISNAQL